MGRPGLSRYRLPLGLAVGVVVFDQLTKAWAERALGDGPIELIDGFLRLGLTYNPGAAFSSFQGVGPLIGILAVGIAAWIVMMIRRAGHTLEMMALALVLGGALGNLVDRVANGPGLLDGSVVDFIDLWFIPTFNVADSAITIGATLLVIAALQRAPDGETDATPPGDA